jgi:hypothetical protein
MKHVALALMLVSACATDPSGPSEPATTADVSSSDVESAPADAAPRDAERPPAPDAESPPSPDAAPPAPETLRVLFIGNSYTFYNDLEQRYAEVRAQDAAPREVVVARYARPGYRLDQHLADVQADASELQVLFSSRCGGDEPWSYVVLQEQSQIPGFPAEETVRQASVEAAGAWGERIRGCGATPVLFETWGRLRGDEGNPELFPDYTTMQDRLDEGFAAMREAGALTSAPVGGAFRWLSTRAGFDLSSLYSGDGSHPSAAGSWLAALVLAGVTPAREAPVEPRGPEGLSAAVLGELEAAAAAITPVP